MLSLSAGLLVSELYFTITGLGKTRDDHKIRIMQMYVDVL